MSDQPYNPDKKQLIHDAPKPAPQAQQPWMYKKQNTQDFNLKNEINPKAEYDPLQDKPVEIIPPFKVVDSPNINTPRTDTMQINKQKVYKFCPHCGENLQS